MRLGKKQRSESFALTTGEVWTLNGQRLPRKSWSDAIARIIEGATQYPARVVITEGSNPSRIVLIHESGRIESAEESEIPVSSEEAAEETQETEEAPEVAEAALEASEESPSTTSLADGNDDLLPGAEEEEPELLDAALTQEPDDGSRNRRKRVVLSAAAVLVFVGLVVAAFAVFAGGESSEAEQSGEETLPEEADPLVINGAHILAAIEDRSSLALYEVSTGEQIETWELSTEDGARVMSTPEALAVDTTNGEVLLVTGENQDVYDGALNTRGAAPVIVDGEQYRSVGDPEESRDLPEGAAIFAGAAEGAYLAESPATVSTPEEDEIDLDSPEGDRALENFIAADSERIVTRWVDDDDSAVLAVHDPATGDLQDTVAVDTETFSVVGDTVLVGESNYLDGGEISPLCEDSEVITETIMCPTDDGWESLDGELTTDTDLLAISGEARVTADHTIETTE